MCWELSQCLAQPCAFLIHVLLSLWSSGLTGPRGLSWCPDRYSSEAGPGSPLPLDVVSRPFYALFPAGRSDVSQGSQIPRWKPLVLVEALSWQHPTFRYEILSYLSSATEQIAPRTQWLKRTVLFYLTLSCIRNWEGSPPPCGISWHRSVVLSCQLHLLGGWEMVSLPLVASRQRLAGPVPLRPAP